MEITTNPLVVGKRLLQPDAVRKIYLLILVLALLIGILYTWTTTVQSLVPSHSLSLCTGAVGPC